MLLNPLEVVTESCLLLRADRCGGVPPRGNEREACPAYILRGSFPLAGKKCVRGATQQTRLGISDERPIRQRFVSAEKSFKNVFGFFRLWIFFQKLELALEF